LGFDPASAPGLVEPEGDDGAERGGQAPDHAGGDFIVGTVKAAQKITTAMNASTIKSEMVSTPPVGSNLPATNSRKVTNTISSAIPIDAG
jgi:hypothetical protein